MTSNLYILPHKTEPRFKIGKADCIESRLMSLGYVNLIDRKKSLYVETPTAKDAFKLEGYLHYIVNDYRLDSLPEDGGSEWFASECMDTAVDAIKQACSMKGFTLSRGLAAPVKTAKRKATTAKSQPRSSRSKRDTLVTLQKFRELKKFLHDYSGFHCYYFVQDYLCICTMTCDLDEKSSLDGLDFVGCRIANRSGGITFVPHIRTIKGGVRFYMPLPNDFCYPKLRRAHVRMINWVMSTLSALGAVEVDTPESMCEKEKAAIEGWPTDGITYL